MLDAGAPVDPCLRHLQAQRCCAITIGFQPEAVVCLQSSRLMHFTLELEQFGIAADAPFPTTFFDLNGKGFSTFFLVPSHGRLVLANGFSNGMACLKPNQAIQAAEVLDRNNRFDGPMPIFGWGVTCRNPQFWGAALFSSALAASI